MKSSKLRVLIVAGGTGGHIYPGIAIAQNFLARGDDVKWLGSSIGMEKTILSTYKNIPLHTIAMPPIRGKGLMRWLLLPYMLAYFIFVSYRLLGKLNIDLVVCMGGFVTMPAGIAAWTRSLPLFLHEQNAVAGLSNRILSRLAQKSFCAFTPTRYLPNAMAIGNPVRAEFADLPVVSERFSSRSGAIRIAVLGGSQGAQILNQTIPAALAALKRPLNVWHQSGKVKIKPNYEDAQITANVEQFISQVSEVYSWADLIIARAGAMTISELAAAGVGAILVPFPHATDDHQNYNAEMLVKCGGAVKILQNDLDKNLVNTLINLLQGNDNEARKRLMSMANCAHSVYRQHKNSTKIIVDTCHQYTEKT